MDEAVNERPTVMVVEDHSLLAASLAVALGADGIDVVRPDDLTLVAVVGLAERVRPQVVLLDLHLDALVTSMAMIGPLTTCGCRVVMMTAETDRAALGECVEAGAVGIVAKTESFDRLLWTVRSCVRGEPLLTTQARDDLLAELRKRRKADAARLAPFESLTPRERRVLAALMDGWSAERMASEWVVSMPTVRSQIRAVLQKLGVGSQLAAVAAARAAGWTPD
jgi:DNA-binding NarL/FixJ family response regulator